MIEYEVLRLIWWVLIGVLLIGFAIMDGYDLGTANLLPFMSKNDEERRIMINAVAPHWDGNQVWLVTAAGAVFAAWPTVYATAFSGFYWALILVLYSLLIRPMAFDYRSKLNDPRWRNTWDWGLFISGAVPSFVFGVAFGNFFLGFGFHLDDLMRSSFTGSFFDLLHPFALLCGIVSAAMLTMHGAVWQKLRAGDPIRQRAGVVAKYAAIMTIVAFALGGIWVANMNGFHITSVIDGNGPSNPLMKTVALEKGMWMNNFILYPWMAIAPALGFVGPIAGDCPEQNNQRRFNVYFLSPGAGRNYNDSRVLPVSICPDFQHQPSHEPDNMGFNLQLSDTGHYDHCRRNFCTDHSGLYNLVFL